MPVLVPPSVEGRLVDVERRLRDVEDFVERLRDAAHMLSQT